MNAAWWEQVAAIAATQLGLVSVDQLVALGATRGTIDNAVRSGRLTRYRRRVFQMAGTPEDRWQALLAALLAVGDEAYASHFAAAGLHAYPHVLAGRAEISVWCRDTPRLAGVRVHAASVVDLDDFAERPPFRLTSPARTLVDMAGQVHESMLRRMAADAFRRRLCTEEQVAACLDRIGGPGRPGTANLRRAVEDWLGGDSDLEDQWLARLKRAGLLPPALQYVLAIDGHDFVLDFAWPEHKVGIECHGWKWHKHREAFDHDNLRLVVMSRGGWTILPVTSKTPVGEVLATLRSLLP